MSFSDQFIAICDYISHSPGLTFAAWLLIGSIVVRLTTRGRA